MVYDIHFDSFTKINEASGTVQNIGEYPIEMSETPTFNNGIVILPNQKNTFSGTDIYLRCTEEGFKSEVRVVPFIVDVKGGDSSSAIGSDSDAFKAVSFVDNTLKFFTSTDTDTAQAAVSIDIPAEQFLDAASTSFVPNFIFSAILYEGATNPNLDGKPVFVLALKTKNNDGILFDVSYKFLDLSSLLDSYISSDTSVVISDYKIKVNVSSDTGNFLRLKSNGLYVDGTTDTATTLSAGLMSAADKLKLDNIADSAQVNVIESVKVNNTKLDIVDKAVNIDLANASVKSAASLNSAKSLKVSLASSNAQSFDGSDNATVIGVGGILPTVYGGTGNANGTVSGAAKLNTAQNFITNLNSTVAGSFNGTASVSAGVTGILPVANGGTGQTDLNNVTVGGANRDGAGNVITDTYVTKTEFNRKVNAVRYGYRIKQSEADPDLRVEYIYDAAGMRPAHMVFDTDTTAGTASDTSYFDYGDWQSVWFVRDNKPLMLKSDGTVDYYLDPNDYSKKEDGTESDVANTDYDGNAMAQFPLVWVKRYTEGDYLYEIISNVQYDDDYHAFAHTDASGNIKDFCYRGLFSASLISNKFRSISGVKHTTDNVTRYVTLATANGNGWNAFYWSLAQLLRVLCTLMFKSCDFYSAFGRGTRVNNVTTFVGNWNVGTLNTKGQFFASNTGTLRSKAFHLEDFVGNVFLRLVGAFGSGRNFFVKMTPEGSGYQNNSVSGYTKVGSFADGFFTHVFANQYGCFPATYGGSSSTYYCSRLMFNSQYSGGNLLPLQFFPNFTIFSNEATQYNYNGIFTTAITYV